MWNITTLCPTKTSPQYKLLQFNKGLLVLYEILDTQTETNQEELSYHSREMQDNISFIIS